MVGQNGGGIFVLIYLFFLVALGIPVMTMEFATGRAAQKSPVLLHRELEPKGTKWHIHGYAALAGNVLLMMFYATIAGWMLRYFVMSLTGGFEGLDPAQINESYGTMLSSPVSQVVYMGLVVVLGFFICSFSLQKGLERFSKFMMGALFVIMIVMVVNGFFMDGAKEGLKFYLVPSVDKLKEVGAGKVISDAMNQAFFTLSTGIGSMAIFGSYIGKDRSLLGESVNIAVLDTLVAFMAGLIIFPACFTHNVEVTDGMGLIFKTLPNIFNNMPLGRLWGTLFFLLMTFAAFSTVIAVFENIIACVRDLTNWSRRKTSVICCAAMFVLCLPCALGFNLLSGIQPMGEGSVIMDIEDFLVSNVLLPLGSLAFVLFCTLKCGWGWKNFEAEANTGKGLKVAKWMRWYMTFVLPILTIGVFAINIYNIFFA
jgi:NSS family neurotransmitter:Na+ symporter